MRPDHVKGRVRALLQEIAQTAAIPAGPRTFSRALRVNGEPVSDETLARLARQSGLQFGDGDFWYDKVSGQWGMRGGPAMGVLPAGFPLGGALPRDASGGNTGVIVNGRELHPIDVARLRQLVPMVLPGRWWSDAAGNFGPEGGPMMGNVWQQFRQAQSGGSGSHTWSGAFGTATLSSDGNGGMMFDSTDPSGTSYSAGSTAPQHRFHHLPRRHIGQCLIGRRKGIGRHQPGQVKARRKAGQRLHVPQIVRLGEGPGAVDLELLAGDDVGIDRRLAAVGVLPHHEVLGIATGHLESFSHR